MKAKYWIIIGITLLFFAFGSIAFFALANIFDVLQSIFMTLYKVFNWFDITFS